MHHRLSGREWWIGRGRWARALLGLAALGALAGGSWAQEQNSITVRFGQRFLDDDTFWEPLEEPFAFGFEFDRRIQGGLGFEVGTQIGVDTEDVGGSDLTLVMWEFGGGLRYTFDAGPAHPYVGAGPLVVATVVDFDAVDSVDDTSFGGYVHAGARFDVARHFAVGIDYRKVFGTQIELDGFVESDADYDQITVSFGWSW